MADKIVEKVLESYRKRSKTGIEKYGTTMERNDLNLLEWLNHLQEDGSNTHLTQPRTPYG